MAGDSATSSPLIIKWTEGDVCLAPDPEDGVLREATVRRLSSFSTEHSPLIAWVIFKDHGAAGVEKSLPMSQLRKPVANSFTQERPFFPGTAVNQIDSLPLELSCEDRVPYTINRYLRDYQREGIKFMYNNYVQDRGCILGDDMGLGKTVQVIGFVAAILHKKGTWEDIESNRPSFLQSQARDKQTDPNKVFLIVAPLSVLYNWKDELETWGHFQVVVVHGLRKEEELNRVRNGRIEIALTTYETLRICLDLFNDIYWSAVIVDEAHKIKNPNSMITQAMKQLQCQIRIGLTGTILQNNLEELWCVMDWAVPKCLGSLGHFKTKFAEPIEQCQKHSATKRALATGRKTVRALVKKISHYFLRRTKALIKEQLPKKDDRVVYCALTDFQQTVYETVLLSEDVRLLLRSSEKCSCGSGQTRRRCCYKVNSEGVEVKKLYFIYLAILRKVANHVALLQSSPGTSKSQKKYLGVICQKVFQQFPNFVQRCKDEAFEALSDPTYSGKMKVLQKLLKHYLQRKDKVLLFSLSTKLLDVLESYVMAEGLDYSRLDGNTKSKERVQIVKEFNTSSSVNICLISTMAGGLGLNFVGANVVILFDPTWNPANDLQAIDRAYRIGQCRDVTVLRLISLGSVEEVIYLRQVYKQQLHSSVVAVESARRYFEAVQGNDAQKGELFGIKNLFRLQTRGMCLTRQILEREGHVEAGVTMTRTAESKEEEAKTLDPEMDNVKPDVSRHCSNLPRGVLDFSSNSEDDDDRITTKRTDCNTIEGTSSSGRITLLQHGFSKLLQRVKGSPDCANRGSSNSEQSSSGEEDPPKETSKSSPDVSNFTAVKDSDKMSCKFKILSDSDSDDSDTSLKEDAPKTNMRKVSLRPPARFNGCSDESEDLDVELITSSRNRALVLPTKKNDSTDKRKTRKRSTSKKDKVKFTENIETFTSSEDEQMRKKPRPRGCSFTFSIKKNETLNQQVAAERQDGPATQSKNGTIDSVLGGVQGVAYTHSNQKVVGGSRAEKLISRAAARDVFERHMFSQMPANHLLGTQESLSESPPDSPPIHSRAASTTRLQRPRVEHPVTFSTRSSHQTRHTTFIIGETPQSIGRQQLEEMSAKFHFPSVENFATAVLKSTSNQRLSWLHQYYTSVDHPDLTDIVSQHFFQPTKATPSSPKASSSSPASAVPCEKSTKATVKVSPNQKRNKRLKYQEAKCQVQAKKQLRLEEIPSPEADWPEEKVEVSRGFFETKRKSRITKDQKGEDDFDQARVDSIVARKNNAEISSPVPEAPAKSSVQEVSKEPTQEPNSNSDFSTGKKSFLTDLIGDTSILNDLFKPKRTTPKLTNSSALVTYQTEPSPSKDSTDSPSSSKTTLPVRCAASSPKSSVKKASKDFWDVLQEGDEESWNRLTDPVEVQKVCVNTNIAARKHREQEESKALWKTNDKFLWKK